MTDRYLRFTRKVVSPDDEREIAEVDRFALRLREHLESSAVDISQAHVFNAGSKIMQQLVTNALEPQGFRSEVRIAGATGYQGAATVDLYRELGESRGIIVEVERGGTIQNNHDLKDFWKTHIASNAHHLFLVVPMANWTRAGAVRERPFRRMRARFGPFFEGDRREVDVLSLHVFGYGTEASLSPPEAANLAGAPESEADKPPTS